MSKTNTVRCTACRGYIAHSYLTYNGIDVYRCGNEDSWNDTGRFFIYTVAGLVEVEPKRYGPDWTYEIIDTEKRRAREEQERINEELDRRQKLYRNNMLGIAMKQAEEKRARRLAGEDDDD